MSELVADFMLSRLRDWGVHRVYGYPGDGINAIIGAFGRAEGDPELIQVRHEEMAAFMACAHAKFTSEVGVCLATSGPGAIHLLNGLYDAKLDHAAVVAIVGQQARAALGGDYQQEVDLVTLFKDVAGEYVHMATVPEQMRHLIDRAIRIALSQRTVTCLIVPNDLASLPAHEPPRAHGTVHSSVGYSAPRVVPNDSDLRQAADALNGGAKVAILVGQGAIGAADEVLDVADRLGAGVAKALLGRAAVPDDVPFVTGSIGLLGTRPSYELMDRCDTLLMIGSSFPYSEFLPEEGQARGVQIDIDARRIGIRYPMDVHLVGDSRETLRALLPMLHRKEDRSWQDSIVGEVEDWWRVMDARAMDPADPINPQRVFWELSERLPARCILAADSGSSANWFARDLKIRAGMMASLSGTLATMGPGVPYAIAAKFAYPDRPAIALVGDGAMQMNGLAELITVAKYWHTWSDPRLVVLVLNNRDLNQVTWEQRAMEGDPRFDVSQSIPDFPYARYAEMIGLRGVRVDDPDLIGQAWDEVLSSDRPAVLEAIVDPEIPPLPPHITFEQAKHFARAALKGDTERGAMIRRSFRQLFDSSDRGAVSTSLTVSAPRIGRTVAAAYTIPTDRLESDGTLEWDSTTIVVAEVEANGERGTGWTYAPPAAVKLIEDLLAPVVEGASPFAVVQAHQAMRRALRNAGVPGLGSMALSAVDTALWDLKAKLLGVAVASLLPQAHTEVPVYGSGGFCSYTPRELADQLAGWVADGIPRVKMKIGRDPAADLCRVRTAREAIGHAELYVDANGALTTKQALSFAEQVASLGVTWFEEPVSSLDREGLHLLRVRAPAGMDIAAGEYASTSGEFVALAGVVDCLQADATRCGGITGLLAAAAIAEGHELDLSGHTAPTIHAHALCAVAKLRHLEWFHDHVRIERMLFDGFLEPVNGSVRPDLNRPGLGVELKRCDAERFAA